MILEDNIEGFLNPAHVVIAVGNNVNEIINKSFYYLKSSSFTYTIFFSNFLTETSFNHVMNKHAMTQ